MKKHKFNWIDGLAIAIVLMLIGGTCLKFLVIDSTAVTTQTTGFTYTLEIRGVRQFTVDALAVGDVLYDNAGKAQVGTIAEIATAPAETAVSYPDGTVRTLPIEDRYDVTLTISAEGVVSDSSYEIGTYDIRVNQTDTYYTKYSIWSGRVVSIGGV